MISPNLFDAIARQIYLIKEQADAALNALELLRPMVGDEKPPEKPSAPIIRTFGGVERKLPSSEKEIDPDAEAARAVEPGEGYIAT